MNLKPHITYLLVFIIGVLLLTHLFFTFHYGKIITRHTRTLKEAEMVRLHTQKVNRWLNLMDMSLLSYALSANQSSRQYFDSSYYLMDSTFSFLESSLHAQGFPMDDFYAYEDSIAAYMQLGRHMFALLEQGKKDEYIALFQRDLGKKAWQNHKSAATKIDNFERVMIEQAGEQHRAVVQRNNYLNIVMLLLVLPTLFYIAYHSGRTFRYSEKRRYAEQSRNKLLSDQNELLEQRVGERTREIEAKREALEQAMQHIQEQNQMIASHNERLEHTVELRTSDLRMANRELEDRIAKMEEYSFVISHKLRAPVANLLGLADLLEMRQPSEDDQLIHYIASSARELDMVLRDLNDFLLLEKVTVDYTEVDLEACIVAAKNQLSREIENSQVEISEFLEIKRFRSEPSMLIKLIYNLLSNAIKFRNPHKKHQVSIRSLSVQDHLRIEIRDNGLGIDLQRYRKRIFQPYQRFHNHVEGKGVGLYLSRLMAEKLGGSLGLQSVVWEGSTFILKLPIL